MTTKIKINKGQYRLTDESRQTLIDTIRGLSEGEYDILIKPKNTRFSATRYKYYFDCVLAIILENCSQHYRIVNPETAEMVEPTSTEQMHEIMKVVYCSTVYVIGGVARAIAGSTRDLSNTDFYQKYLEQIIS